MNKGKGLYLAASKTGKGYSSQDNLRALLGMGFSANMIGHMICNKNTSHRHLSQQNPEKFKQLLEFCQDMEPYVGEDIVFLLECYPGEDKALGYMNEPFRLWNYPNGPDALIGWFRGEWTWQDAYILCNK